jgi:macrolide transport system ATP-binding/permease protein
MLAPLRVLWKGLFHRNSWECDLAEELRFHLECRVDDLVRRGLGRAEALRQARIEFGAAATCREQCRQAHGVHWFEEFLQDLRYVARTLRRSPGFTAAAVVSLALGIGANSAVFSVVSALVLQPLPVQSPGTLYFIQPRNSPYQSLPNYRDLSGRSRTMAGLAAYAIRVMSVERGAGAERVWGYLATGNYFDLLGIRPALGRFFHAADDLGRGASPYAVLSYNCWSSRFGADPRVVGETIHINGLPYTVLGVAPRAFHGTEVFYWPDIWVPMTMQPRIDPHDLLDARDARIAWVVGRPKPGIAREQAEADLSAVSAALAREYPQVNEPQRVALARPGLVGNTVRAPLKAFTGGVMVLAFLVLLAVCANLASLLAARAADRSRELAVRLSLGAGRGRIFRQLLTESIALAALGGIAGCALAVLLAGLVSRWRPPLDIPGGLQVQLDWRVFAFSAAASLVAALLSALAPARQVWRSDPNQALKGGGTASRGPRFLPLRDLLVGVQVAICCALVACCFVSVRGLSRAFSTSIGLEPRGVSAVSFDLDPARYTPGTGREFQRRALEQVSRIPGVTAAAFAGAVPLAGGNSGITVFREAATGFRPAESIAVTVYDVSPGYFGAAGTRLMAGRGFTWHDDAQAPLVAVVNRRLARLLTGSENAVGARFRYDGGRLAQIVGVAEDGKYTSLTEDPAAALFRPSLQSYNGSTVLIARSSLPELALSSAMREAVAALDPHLPLYRVGGLGEMQRLVFLPSRAAVTALGSFALLALVLAITGIYGLSAYSVSRRVREIGIRVALGAPPRQVLACVLRRSAWLVLAGSCVGLALAWLSGRVLAHVVFQASARDPLVLIAAALTLAAAGLGASLGPARRALRIDSAAALRHE